MSIDVVTKTSKKIALVSLFSVLTALGAFIAIPIPPIPFTLQIIFVLLSGSLLYSKGNHLLGFYSQILYIAVGLMGMPIFAGFKGGPSIIVSPTFGYLLMFPIAALISSFASREKRNWLVNSGIFLVAVLTIYAGGALYLNFYFIYILGKQMSFTAIMLAGVLPFLPFDLIKIGIAVFIHSRMSKIYNISSN